MENLNTEYVTENYCFASDPVLLILSNFLDAENITHLIDVEWIRNNMQFDLPRKNTKGLKPYQHDLLKRLKTAYEKALQSEHITGDFRYYLDNEQDDTNQAVRFYKLEVSSKDLKPYQDAQFILKTAYPDILYVITKSRRINDPSISTWNVELRNSNDKFLGMRGSYRSLRFACMALTD